MSTRTDIAGNTIVERRHWSFSAIEKFTQCARRFHAYDIAKLVSEPQNPKMNEGLRVHRAMAECIDKGTPLPDDIAHYAAWTHAERTREPDEQVLVEQKMACTFELVPCDYFSKKQKVWLRTVADLLVINGPHARSWDWKTGQEKDPRYELLPEHFQLKLVALTVFLHHPKVHQIDSAYVYLEQGEKVGFTMQRADLKHFIPQMYDIAAGLQRAVRASNFPPRPSGLCKKHCAVTGCEYHGKGAY